ncbi:hypothetical protein CPC16_003971, partial [Podila verticillata]
LAPMSWLPKILLAVTLRLNIRAHTRFSLAQQMALTHSLAPLLRYYPAGTLLGNSSRSCRPLMPGMTSHMRLKRSSTIQSPMRGCCT